MRVAVLLVTLTLAGCLAAEPDGPGKGNPDAASAGAPQAVRFIAIGDMGTGDEAQVRVAVAMKTVCDAVGCDFVVGLGDNIYEAGATSPYDPQFMLKFEQPYSALALPFFMVLGNHDNAAVRSGHAAGDFQVAYAARTDRAMDAWTMPARWYEHQHGQVRFLALDTNVVFTAAGAAGQVAAPALSRDPDGIAQLAWVKDRLSNPGNASWTFTHGHHPLFSNGEHGDARIESPSLDLWLREALCSSPGIDVVLSGHDHDLQYIPAAADRCGATEFIISGAAAQVRSIDGVAHEDTLFACGDTLGFTWVEVVGQRMTARVYDVEGKAMFERVLDRANPTESSATTFAERTATCSP